MVIVLFVCLAFLGLEEVVASDELEDHAGKTPNVSTFVVLASHDDFGPSILACLYNIGVMIVDPAGVAHIAKLDIEL